MRILVNKSFYSLSSPSNNLYNLVMCLLFMRLVDFVVPSLTIVTSACASNLSGGCYQGGERRYAPNGKPFYEAILENDKGTSCDTTHITGTDAQIDWIVKNLRPGEELKYKGGRRRTINFRWLVFED
jgi:hypothetical protein